MAYDAVAFLKGLFQEREESSVDGGIAVSQAVAGQTAGIFGPANLPADWRIEWEERAAIREYDGGQVREHAEAEALAEIVQRMRAAGQYP